MVKRAVKVNQVNQVNQVIGYIRVSTDKQDSKRQKDDILNYTNNKKFGNVEFVSEIISSRKKERQIYTLIKKLKSGDKIIVTELSRLGRSIIQVNEIVSKAIDKDIEIYVQNKDLKIDGSVESQTMVFAFSLSAQVERDLISERTISALKARKKAGVILGRKPGKGRKLEKYFNENPAEKEKYTYLKNNGVSIRRIAKELKMSPVQVGQYFKNQALKKSSSIENMKK